MIATIGIIQNKKPVNVKVLYTKGDQLKGMKAYKKCKEAPQYLIFPKPNNVFTMKGVKFPVKIIGVKEGKVIYERIHLPEEEIINLPNPDLVIESPICN